MNQYIDKLRHSGEGDKKKMTNLVAQQNRRDNGTLRDSNETPHGGLSYSQNKQSKMNKNL